MKKVFMCALLCLGLAACGGSGDSNGGFPTTILTSGNWSLHANSQVLTPGPNNTVLIGGNLSQSGTSVSGTVHVMGSSCFDFSTNLTFSGTASSGNKVRITSAPMNGQVITVDGTVSDSTHFSGTYAISGGCANGDHGTIAAASVPSLSGTWRATEHVGEGTLITTATINQGTIADQYGSFPLSGTISFNDTSLTCFNGGTINTVNSILVGELVGIYADMTDHNGQPGQLLYAGLLDDPGTARSITGSYMYQSPTCSTDLINLSFTKQ